MPNVQNINKVIESIRYHYTVGKVFLDMKTFLNSAHHSCGTTACIAGFAAMESVGLDSLKHLSDDNRTLKIKNSAREFLGLDSSTSHDLFFPDGAYEATPKQAIKVLEHLRDFGVVDWSIINPDWEKQKRARQNFIKNKPASV